MRLPLPALRPTLLLALLLAACTSGMTPASPARGMRDVISEEELRGVSATSVYTAIQQLRPAMLRQRGVRSGSGEVAPVVYLDGQQYGGLRELANLSLTGVREVRYLSPADATQRFGTNHTAGAILVTRGGSGGT